jgi:hypothetical protein
MSKKNQEDDDTVENLVNLSLSFGMVDEYLDILHWNKEAIEKSFVYKMQCDSCGKAKRSHNKKKDDRSDDTTGRIKKILSIAKIDEKRIVSFD